MNPEEPVQEKELREVNSVFARLYAEDRWRWAGLQEGKVLAKGHVLADGSKVHDGLAAFEVNGVRFTFENARNDPWAPLRERMCVAIETQAEDGWKQIWGERETGLWGHGRGAFEGKPDAVWGVVREAIGGLERQLKAHEQVVLGAESPEREPWLAGKEQGVESHEDL